MRRGTWFLIGAVVAGMVAAVLAVNTVQRFNETERVLVAARELEPYKRLSRDDIRVAEVPLIMVPADALRRAEEVVDRYLKDRVLAGEVLRAPRLADTVADRILTAQLTDLKDPALRAFALPFKPDMAVGGKMRPGDRVDIIASVRIEAGDGRAMGVGKIVARAVQVLEVNASGSGSEATVVLALYPGQIEDIAFALTAGQLRFALNPYNFDVTAAETGGVTGRAWLERYGFLSAAPGAGASGKGER